jgi:hypothetical protein
MATRSHGREGDVTVLGAASELGSELEETSTRHLRIRLARSRHLHGGDARHRCPASGVAGIDLWTTVPDARPVGRNRSAQTREIRGATTTASIPGPT